MANRYWVGGSAAWSSTNTAAWSASSGGAGGASVPTSADNVFFDQAGTYTVTITGTGQACNALTISAGTVTIAGSTSPSLAIYGNFSITASTVWNEIGGNGTIFNGTATRTINTNGATLNCNLYIGSIAGGTYTLNSNLTVAPAYGITLRGGTLNLNGFSLTTGTFSTENAVTYNNQARSIIFGTSNIYITSATGSIYHVDMRTPTGLTISESGGGFVMNANVYRIVSFNGGQATTAGAASTNAPNLYFTTGSAGIQIADTSEDATTAVPFHKYKKVDFGQVSSTLGGGTSAKFVVRDLILSPNMNAAVAWPWYDDFGQTCTIKTNGNTTCGGTQIIKGQGLKLLDNCTLSKTSPAAPQFQLSAGTLDLNNFNLDNSGCYLKDAGVGTKAINFGTGIWYAQYCTNTNVTGMTVTTNGGYMYMTNTAAQTYAWGTTGGSYTNALPVKFGFNSSSAVVTLTTNSWYRNLDFSATTFNLNAGAATTLNIAGNLILGTGTYTGLTANIVGSNETQTITTNGLTIAALTINSPGSTISLNGNLSTSATSTTTLTAGTFVLGDFNLSTGLFNASGTTARGLSFNNGRIIITYATAAAVNANIADATNFTCTTTGTGGFQATANISRSWTFCTTGGSSANAPSLYILSGVGIQTYTTGSWFNRLETASTGTVPTTSINLNSLSLPATGTYSNVVVTMRGTGTVNTNGRTINAFNVNMDNPTYTCSLQGSVITTATTTSTLTQGNLVLNDFTLSVGVFNSDNSNTRSIAFGTGSIALINTNSLIVCVAMATMTGFTCTGTGGFTSTPSTTRNFNTGATAGGSSANAPNLTFTSTGTLSQTIISGSWFNKLDFGTTSFSPGNITVNVNTFIGSSGGTFTSTTVNMVGAGYINMPTGKYIAGININCPGKTAYLTSNVATNLGTQTGTLTAGTLDLNSYTLTVGLFNSSNTNTRSINFNTGSIVLSSTTSLATVINMADTTGFTCSGTGGFVSAVSVNKTFVVGTTGGSAAGAPNLSLNSGTFVATITSGSWFGALNFTGYTGTPATSTVNVISLTLPSTGTYTNLSFTMVSTGRIITNGKTIANLEINCPGGSTTLDSAVTVSGDTTLTAGTLNLLVSSLATARFYSTNTNTRSIDFGTSTIALTHTSASQLVLSMDNATGFTWTAGTGGGGFTTNMSVSRSFAFGNTAGGSASNAVNLYLTSGASSISIYAWSWFKTLDFTGTSNTDGTWGGKVNVDTLVLSSTGTYQYAIPIFTRSQLWTPQFSKPLGGIGVNCPGGTLTLDGTQDFGSYGNIELVSGTLNLNGFDLNCGIINSSYTSQRSIAFGTNSIIISRGGIADSMTYPNQIGAGVYMENATNFTYTGTGNIQFPTNRATVYNSILGSVAYYFGTTAGGNVNNAFNVTFTNPDESSLATYQSKIGSGSWVKNLNIVKGFYDNASQPTVNVAGNLSYPATGTTDSLVINMVGTGSITHNANPIWDTTINTVGTITLADSSAATSTKNLTFTSGTLNLNGKTIGIYAFSSNGTATRSIIGNNGTISLQTNWDLLDATNFSTTNDYTIKFTGIATKLFKGNGLSYGTLNIASSVGPRISGSNTFTNLLVTNTVGATTITFIAGTNQTITGNVSISGRSATTRTSLRSYTTGSRFTLTKASGTVAVDYIDYKDSNVTGGAVWYANTTTNIDNGNNQGWVYALTSTVSGQFMAFF